MTNESTSNEETKSETSTETSASASVESDEDKKKDKKKDKPKKVEIAYEASMPRDEAVSYFEALVGGLRTGHLEFRQDERVLVLAPPDRLEIEVTAQQKGDKGKVVFEIEWSGHRRPLAIVTEAGSRAAPADESEEDD